MDSKNCISAPLVLRGLRRNARLTQRQVADAVGIAQTTVSSVENPRASRPIALRVIRRLCDYYGIELWELLWLDAGAPKPSAAAHELRRSMRRSG